MKHLKTAVFGALCLTFSTALSPAARAEVAGIGANVILVTIDGVRYEEFFKGVDPVLAQASTEVFFKTLKGLQKTSGAFILGDQITSVATVSNAANVSLPAYQSILSGATQPCMDNNCGRIGVQTLQEGLVNMGWPKHEAVTLGSWDKIAYAAESHEGATFVNVAREDLTDPITGLSDPELVKINKAQAADKPPWSDVRYDKYTWAHALRYLKVNKPSLLYVSLNDTDEYGHANQYSKYLAALRERDQWISDLIQTLGTMGEYGRNTILLVTTDHGRGKGFQWTGHGSNIENSRYIWFFGHDLSGKNRLARLETVTHFEHNDIRPLIESLLKPASTL